MRLPTQAYEMFKNVHIHTIVEHPGLLQVSFAILMILFFLTLPCVSYEARRLLFMIHEPTKWNTQAEKEKKKEKDRDERNVAGELVVPRVHSKNSEDGIGVEISLAPGDKSRIVSDPRSCSLTLENPHSHRISHLSLYLMSRPRCTLARHDISTFHSLRLSFTNDIKMT